MLKLARLLFKDSFWAALGYRDISRHQFCLVMLAVIPQSDLYQLLQAWQGVVMHDSCNNVHID